MGFIVFCVRLGASTSSRAYLVHMPYSTKPFAGQTLLFPDVSLANTRWRTHTCLLPARARYPDPDPTQTYPHPDVSPPNRPYSRYIVVAVVVVVVVFVVVFVVIVLTLTRTIKSVVNGQDRLQSLLYHRMYIWFCPPHAGYTVSLRRTRLNVFFLLTLASAGESPTCILHEGTHPIIRAIEVSHAAC